MQGFALPILGWKFSGDLGVEFGKGGLGAGKDLRGVNSPRDHPSKQQFPPGASQSVVFSGPTWRLSGLDRQTDRSIAVRGYMIVPRSRRL